MSWAFSANPHDAGGLGGAFTDPHVLRLFTAHISPRGGGRPEPGGG